MIDMEWEEIERWCKADAGVKAAVASCTAHEKKLAETSAASTATKAQITALDARMVTEGGQSLGSLDDLIEQRSKLAAKDLALERILASQVGEQPRLREAIGDAWVAAYEAWCEAFEKKIESVRKKAAPHLEALKQIQGCDFEPVKFEDKKMYSQRGDSNYETDLPLDYRMERDLVFYRRELGQLRADTQKKGGYIFRSWSERLAA